MSPYPYLIPVGKSPDNFETIHRNPRPILHFVSQYHRKLVTSNDMQIICNIVKHAKLAVTSSILKLFPYALDFTELFIIANSPHLSFAD